MRKEIKSLSPDHSIMTSPSWKSVFAIKKIIINGHAQHGKDYFADAVAKATGFKKLNASMWFAEKVLIPAFPGKWSCVEDAYLDRVNHRDLWYQMMRIGNWQAKFMEVSDIFCGHRNIDEHCRMVKTWKRGECLRIWVEWQGKPPEPVSSNQWSENDSAVALEHDIIVRHAGKGVPDDILNDIVKRVQK